MQKDLYLSEAIRYIPHLMGLADRNFLSPNFGCFDRAFWHYRTSDFPSGMFQEAVLPLAIFYRLNHPSNPLYNKERILDLVVGGIDFAMRSSHADGSCDDYFPYERAAGAAAFSLYACTEASRLLSLHLKHPHFLDFFKKRAMNLAEKGMKESGTLSNHKALIVLAVYNAFKVTGDASLKQKAEDALTALLKIQNQEGWFPEYEGCDPGYTTFTIDFLAKYYQLSGDDRVLEPLGRAIRFASHFIHPDGSFGGEYGSRNTFHFMPHGFEVMAKHFPEAGILARKFLFSLEKGTRSYIDDDRIMIHYVYNYLQAHIDFFQKVESLPVQSEISSTEVFSESGLISSQKKDSAVFFSVKKGTGKIFKNSKLIFSDSGITGKTSEGNLFTSHVFGAVTEFDHSDGKLKIVGQTFKQDTVFFTPWTFWLFRAFLIFLGRFLDENTVRKLLQKKAILKKKIPVPLTWEKEINLQDPTKIIYTFELTDPQFSIADLRIATDATFIYIATSQPYQPGNLIPWVDLRSILPTLNRDRKIKYEHSLT